MSLDKILRKLKNGDPSIIVALGDSLTYGWMVEAGYIDFFKEMILSKYPGSDIQIISKGVPGDTALDGLYRVERDVIIHKPDLVLIQFALNDAFSGCPGSRFQETIQAIINKVRTDTRAEILLVTSILPGNEYDENIVNGFFDRLRNIAETSNISFVVVHEYWKKKISEGIPFSSLLQTDQVHPTVEGYRLMAEAIMEQF
jgi:lysophospholipase L1-like esterase